MSFQQAPDSFMKHIVTKAALFSILLALACRTASAVDNTDVIVIAGRSNAVGYGIGPGVDPVSDPRVLQWEYDGTVALATNPLSGPQSEVGLFGSGLYLAGLGFVGPVPTSTPLQIAAVRGADNALWIKTHDGTRWSYWSPLGGTLPEDPALVRGADGRWDVFALGSDNLLWARGNAGGNWTGWQPLGPPAAGLTFTGRPTAVATQNGRVDAAALGMDQSIWTINRQRGVWSAWTKMPGASPQSPSFLATPDGGAWLLAWEWVGGAWYDRLSSAGAWSGWTSLGGSAASEVNGAVDAGGNLNVLAIAPDQSLRTTRVIKGVAWGCTNLGGTVAGTYVWPVVEDDGDLTVVTLGANLALNGRTRSNATGSWGKWTKVGAGGVLARAPTVVQGPDGNPVVFGLNQAGAFSSLSCVGETWGTWTKSD
jgi:hypothetical protein